MEHNVDASNSKNDLDSTDDSANIPSKSNQIEDYENNLNARWINNKGDEVEEVFGFNENAELVNSRAAMFGFLMLILTELVFKGEAATKSIFGIG